MILKGLMRFIGISRDLYSGVINGIFEDSM